MKQLKSHVSWPGVLSVVALAALTACGGGSGTPTPTAAAPDDTPQAEASPEHAGAGLALDALRESVDVASFAPPATSLDRALASSDTATPRVAILAWTNWTEPTFQSHIARFSMAVLGMTASTPASTMTSVVSALKSKNPGMLVGQSTRITDINDSQTALASAANTAKWWLTDDTTSARVSTSKAVGVFDANLTSWGATDTAGKRWPQWKAEYDTTNFFQRAPGLDFVYTDYVWPQTVNASFKRNGSNQAWTDADVQAANRAGYVSYWNTLRALNPNLKVVSNVSEAWLNSAEIKGQTHGAFLNSLIGRTWSDETRLGWSRMMDRYRAALANTVAPKAVVFNAAGSATDYKLMRYGLASTLMGDGLYSYTATDGPTPAPWFDEFSAPIGIAAEAAPTAATSSGIWKRAYANGIVLVNPSATASATYNVGTGYQRLSGTQDPAVNNGAATTSVTLGPREGLILVKTPPAPVVVAPTAPTAPTAVDKTTPKVARVAYNNLEDAATQALIAKHNFVVLGLPASLAASRHQTVVNNIKRLNPAIKLAQYTDLVEVDKVNTWWQPIASKITAADWWLKSATTNAPVGHTNSPVYFTNITKWAPSDANGKRFHQVKAEFDISKWFNAISGLEYAYMDSVGPQWVTADWKRLGVNQASPGDAEVHASMRESFAAYARAMSTLKPGLKTIANLWGDWLGKPEFENAFDMVFQEHMMGKSYSWETAQGWTKMMSVYRGAIASSKTKDVVFNIYANPTDYAFIRYGMASALLDNGHFSVMPMSGSIGWIDEYSAPLGTPVDAPPLAAAASGAWVRKYTNGIVLVNPSKTATVTVDVGAGYKRLTGTQDPATNNGQATSTVTMAPRSGLILVKQ